MSLSFSHLYEFGEFRLDTKEKILIRGDEPIALTPKGFELLSLMVENHGRLLKKDELMDKIWADSFVEESNLTFNIRQLRKILGDDAHAPKYIKTVRQHGYRFIAEVRQISAEEKLKDEAQVSFPEVKSEAEKPQAFEPTDLQSASIVPAEQPSAAPLPKTRNILAPVFVASVILLIGAVVISSWYERSKSSAPSAPVLSAPFAAEKLSTNGKVFNAVISPDGKNVVYTNGTNSDKESVWIRQIEDGSNIEIIPPSDDIYAGLEFSPDGNLLYFTRLPRLMNVTRDIYRVSIFGGVPQKIISEVQGSISISPDGKQISFVRCPHRDDEYCSLWIADAADGKNERKLVSRPRPFRIADNRISPDGKTIAFAAGQSATASNEFGLSEVDLGTGAERELTKEKFFDIENLAWLPDKSGWLLTASRVPNKSFRIWHISAATGEAELLTKNSETYEVLSLDQEATKIVSTQIKQEFHLRLLSLENPSVRQALADGTSVSFAPDGKVYFASGMSGNDEIWSINSDGSSQRQLTNNAADESVPIASPDGNSVFFLSNRTGAAQVWRMNPDGSNQTQITQKEGGEPIFVSPDGEWVYYHPSLSLKLWRASTKGGEEQLVLDRAKFRFAISPDGLYVAFSDKQGEERVLAIASLADGQTVKTFRLANPKALLPNIVWLPDAKSLAYVATNHDYEDTALWLQTLDGKTPRQIADLGDGEINPNFGLAVSPDGKNFAVAQGRWLHDAVLIKGLR
jgi:Tol biopolymer transport system component/DNA-binding winged helix-turn-helix (wHTH) protein